eukprot:NODE_653_length_4981_cov_0.275092.p4 type:complete len:261 gc:universal NODE_653_length_4981_cov_0.275092:1483-2265(+)
MFFHLNVFTLFCCMRPAISDIKATIYFTNDNFVIKSFKRNKKSQRNDLQQRQFEVMKDICNEIDLLPRIKHEHIINITEIQSNCHLQHPTFASYKMKKYKQIRLNDMDTQAIWAFTTQISSALAYLHGLNPPIAHRDIKLENILVENEHYVLSDFGLALQGQMGQNRVMTLDKSGSMSYVAPEVLNYGEIDAIPSDIYSLGVCIGELLGQVKSMHDLNDKKDRELLESMVYLMILPEPYKRPTSSDLIKVFQKIDGNKYS